MQPSSAEQLLRVESLGLNCEVGNVLRRLGNEVPSLFRWTWAPPTAVLDLLRADFAGLYDVEALAPGHHDEVLDTRYNVWFHTNVRTGDPDGGANFRFLDPDQKKRHRILQAERSVIETLVDRFRQRMQMPNTLFVLSRHAREPAGSITEIAAEIRRRAGQTNFTLLEVFETSDPTLVSRVETVDDTLLRGFVARFAPHDAAHDIDIASWTPLLKTALAMTDARPWWRQGRRAPQAVG